MEYGFCEERGMEYKELSPNVRWNSPVHETINILILSHPEQVSPCVDKVKDFLWSILPDAIIWQPQLRVTDEKQLIEEVKRMDAVICFMTAQFLQSKNYILDCILPYIIEKKYPFLPILDTKNHKKTYEEKFGTIHYVDNTEINKNTFDAIKRFVLKTQSDKQHCFSVSEDSSIFSQIYFVSYRRIDGKYVDAIQRLIHKDKRLYTTRVWYDSYETPGEDYEYILFNTINQCSAVVLLVTPHLLEADNYVSRIEIPYARACNKPIIALLMEETDLNKLYETIQIKKVYKVNEWESFGEILLDSKISLPNKKLSPMKMVQLAESYMNGKDVERNIDVACQLLYQAKENYYIPAYETLIKIKTGEFEKQQKEYANTVKKLSPVDIIKKIKDENPDCDDEFSLITLFLQEYENEHDEDQSETYKDKAEAIRLLRELKDINMKLYENIKSEEFLISLFDSTRKYGEFCLQEGLLDEAYYQFREIYEYMRAEVGEDVNKFTSYLSVASLLLGDIFKEMGKYEKAEEYYRKSVDLDISANDDGPIGNSVAYTNVLESLCKLGDFLQNRGELLKAKIIYQELLDTTKRNGTMYMRSWDSDKVYKGFEDSRAAKITEETVQFAIISLMEIESALNQKGEFQPQIKKVSREYITDAAILQSTDKEEIELLSHEIMINTMSKMLWLANFLSNFEMDFDICQKQYCVNAKSISALFSLNILDTGIIVVHSTDFVRSAEILKEIVGELND